MLRKFTCIAFITFFLLPVVVIGQKPVFTELTQIQSPRNPRLGFMVHGGAGVLSKAAMTPEKEKAFRADLEKAVLAGYKALQEGNSGLDAVVAAIRILEDSPLFNAGKGAVFANSGKNELDASIMDGKSQAAGAVAGLRHIRNPILLARAVMEKSEHVMMIGDGAEKFAKTQNIEFVEEKYFWTQHRWDALQQILKDEGEKRKDVQVPTSKGQSRTSDIGHRTLDFNRFGTVGAVALDKNGDLAAGTSTGGMTNKKFGRVGDAPIIGAGTYANNNSCAVSATGWGEYFIRLGVARDVCALLEYRQMPIQKAADTVIKEKLQKLGGDGGVIAMDRFGFMAVSFNSAGMYRAYIDVNGKPVVEIY